MSSSPEAVLFLRSLINNPLKIGALAPSSPRLSRRVALSVGPGSGPVLEVGAGTGAITRALLSHGIATERLVVVERDPALADYLHMQFPGVRVRCGDALDAAEILADESLGQAGTIVSSLPLRNFLPAEQKRVMRAMMEALTPQGHLIQFTYAAGCPIQREELGLEAKCLGRVWLNLPPAAIWRFTTAAARPTKTTP